MRDFKNSDDDTHTKNVALSDFGNYVCLEVDTQSSDKPTKDLCVVLKKLFVQEKWICLQELNFCFFFILQSSRIPSIHDYNN